MSHKSANTVIEEPNITENDWDNRSNWHYPINISLLLPFGSGAIPTPPGVTADKVEIVFIESNVADYQKLIDSLAPGTEVHVLDASANGLTQMAAILEGRSGIDAIHLISHGAEGQVQLGSLTLSNDNLDQQRDVLAQIGAALSADGDILLYGCDVAKGNDGKILVSSLAKLTQADVAASNDLTGASWLGGNWILESSTGNILQNAILVFDNYNLVLTGNSANFTSDTGNTISADATVSTGSPQKTIDITIGSDTITLTSTGPSAGFYIDTISGLGSGVSDNGTTLTGNVIYTQNNDYTTSVSVSIDSGKVFDLDSIFIQETDNVPETYVLTTNTSKTVNVARTAAQGGLVDLSVNNDFKGISSFTITATTQSGNFVVMLDSISLSNIHVPSSNTPSLSATGATTAYIENGSAVDLFSSVTADTNDSGQNFTALTLTVANVADGGSEILRINNADVPLTTATIGLSLGTNAGSVTVTDVSGNKVVTITGMNLDNTAYANLIDGISYRNTSEAPNPVNRTITLTQVTDAGASNNTATPTGSAANVIVTPVNDAPTLSTGASLTAIAEDVASSDVETAGYPNQGDDIAGLLAASGFADVDNGSSGFRGIAIVANASNPTTEGKWQYSTDINTFFWHDIGTVSTAAALLLGTTGSSSTYLRFVPVANFNGTPGALTVYAVDNSSAGQALNYTTWNGTTEARYIFNTTTDDGTSPVSASGQNWTITVNNVNDAPTDISLSNHSVSTFDSPNAAVGTLSDTDLDGPSATYSIVSITDPSSNTTTGPGVFTISGTTIQAATPSSLTVGDYIVRVQVDDGGAAGTYQKDLTVTVDSSLTVDVNAIDSNAVAGTYAIDAADGSTPGLDLKEALYYANIAGGPVTIRFAPTLFGTISAPNNALNVRDGVTLRMDSDTNSRSLSILAGGASSEFDLTSSSSTAQLTVDVASGDALTIAPKLADNGTVTSSLVKSGAGTLTLGGTNNTAGTGLNTLEIQAGTVLVTDGTNLGTSTVTLENGGTLTATGTGAKTISNSIALGTGGGTINYANTGGSDVLTLSGEITGGSSVGLTKTGAGKVVLSNTHNNDSGHDWTTTVTAGTLSITDQSTIGTGAIALSGGSTLSFTGNGSKFADGTTTGHITGSYIFNVINNDISIGSGGASLTTTGQLSLRGAITGSGTLTLPSGIQGVNAWNMNSFTGNISISGRFLELWGTSNLGSGTVTLNNSTQLIMSGDTRTIGNNIALASNASLVSDDGSFDTASGAVFTFSGNISETGGARSLTLTNSVASNSFVLSGSNSYSGTTTIDTNSKVSVTSGANLGTGSGLTLKTGSTLAITGTNTLSKTITLSGNATVEVGGSVAAGLSGVISGSFSLTKTGTGVLTLSGANTYTGTTTVSQGTLIAASNTALGSTSAGTTVASVATLQLANGVSLLENLSLAGTGAGGTAGALTVASGGTASDSGTVILTAATTINLGASTALTLGGNISGAFGLTETGGGTLTLGGSNSSGYTTTSVTSGSTLSVTSGTNLGSGAVTLDNGTLKITGTGATAISRGIALGIGGGTVSYANTGASDLVTLSGQITGTTTLTKSGAGAVVLANTSNSSASFTTTVTAGTLELNSPTSIGTGTITLNGGTLSTALSVTGTTKIGSSAQDNIELPNTVFVDSSGGSLQSLGSTQLTLKGALTGAGTLTKLGSQYVNLWNANGFTGNITVNNGPLEAYGTGTFGSGIITLNSGAQLYASGSTRTLSNNIVLAGNAQLRTDAANYLMANGAVITFSGNISETGGARNLTVGNDDGTNNNAIVLSGINSYTGTTTLDSNSTLKIAAANNLGSGAVTMNAGATLDITGSASLNNDLTLSGSGNATIQVESGMTATLSGIISGGGTTRTFFKTGTGTLILSNTSDTYTDAISVTAGMLVAGSNTALGSTSAGTTVASGATLLLANGISTGDAVTISGNGISGTSGALALASGATSSTVSGAVTLASNATVGVDTGCTLTLSGGITDSSNTYALTKIGTGILTLSGTQSYHGATLVSSGTLQTNSLGNSASLTLDGGTLQTLASGNLSFSNDVTLGAGSGTFDLSNGNITLTGALGGNGNMAVTMSGGSKVLSLQHANSAYTGTTNLNAGILEIGDNQALGTNTLVVNGGKVRALGTNSYTLSNALTLGGTLTESGSGSLTFNGNVDLGVATRGIDVAASTGVTLTLAGIISNGGVTVNPTGTGELILTGVNTYSGGTTVSNGKLTGNATSLQGNISIAGGATLNFDQTSDGIYGGMLSGNGALTKQGSGTLTVTGNNTFTGTTTLSAGTLVISSDNALGTTANDTNIANGATLALAGGLTVAEALTINGGTLTLNSGGSTVTAIVTLNANSTINVGSGANLALSGGITDNVNSFGFSKTGTGILTITNANINGGSTLSDGSLKTTGTFGTMTVTNSAVLEPGVSGSDSLNTDSLSVTGNAILAMELGGVTAGSGYDQINVTGTVTLTNAELDLTLINAFTPSVGNSFTLIANDGTADAVTGSFSIVKVNNTTTSISNNRFTAGGLTYELVYNGGDGNDVTVSVIDVTPPTITVSSNQSALKIGDTATLTFTLSEAATDFTRSDVTVTGGTLSNFTGSGTSYTATFTPTANSTNNGVISVASTAFSDATGNSNSDGADSDNTVTLTVDTLRPTIALSSDKSALKAGETATLTFTLSEAATDFTRSDVTVTGGTLSNFTGSGTSYTATFTPTANSTSNGVISVASSAFSDAAGNSNSDGADSDNTVTITVDTILPTTPVISSSALSNNPMPVVAGIAEADAVVTVVIAGATYITTAAGNGSWSIDTGTATPNSGTLALNINGSNSVAVTATDAVGNASSQAQQTLVIQTTNSSPTIVSASTDSSGIIAEPELSTGSAANLTVTGNIVFADSDLSDSHQASQTLNELLWSDGTLTTQQQAVLTNAFSLGSLSDSTGSGQGQFAWTWALAENSLDFLSEGETLTLRYTVTLTDNHGATSTQPVVITVTGANDQAQLSADTPSISALPGHSIDGSLLGNDFDPDQHDTLTVTALHTGSPEQTGTQGTLGSPLTGHYGQLVLDSNGHYHYLLASDNAELNALAFGQTVSDIFTYTVTDSTGASTTTTLAFTLRGIDSAANDQDGIGTDVENAVNGGDSNDDGVADAAQNNITVLPLRSAGEFDQGSAAPVASYGAIVLGDVSNASSSVTLDNNAQLGAINVLTPTEAAAQYGADVAAALADNPSDPVMTGLLDFTVQANDGGALTDLDPSRDGVQTRVIIELPEGVTADTYYKIGRTPAQSTAHVYAFMADNDLNTYDDGAQLLDLNGDGDIERIVLTFTDGQTGDDDLSANGIIVDPGYLGYASTNPGQTITGLGDTVVYLEGHKPAQPYRTLALSGFNDTTMTNAQVTLTGFRIGDFLHVKTYHTGISAHYDQQSGILSLTGSASTAQYQKVLNSLKYAGQENFWHQETRQLLLTVMDQAGHSASAPLSLNIIPSIIIGTPQPDVINGTFAGDVIRGLADDDRLFGRRGPDVLVGRSGDDFLEGGAGSDFLRGQNGNDSLSAGLGRDTLSGGRGDDWLVSSPGNDWFRGGKGQDTVDFSASTDGVQVNLNRVQHRQWVSLDNGYDRFTRIDHLTGSAYADHLIGNNQANRLKGLSGDDALWGHAGNDSINGGKGNDRLQGNHGQDTLRGGLGNDTLRGGGGDDDFIGPDQGNDVYLGGKGQDTLSYRVSASAVNVDLTLHSRQTVGHGHGQDLILHIENLHGSRFDDQLTGDDRNNHLNGGQGHDSLTGGAGADIFIFDQALRRSNFDILTDFNPKHDSLVLSAAVFTAFADQIGQRLSLGEQLAYDTSTGQLSYDADGTGTAPTYVIAVLGIEQHPSTISAIWVSA